MGALWAHFNKRHMMDKGRLREELLETLQSFPGEPARRQDVEKVLPNLYNRVSEAHHYSVSSGQPSVLISGQQPVLAAVGLACVAMKQMSLLDISVLYTSMDKHADVTVYGLKARHPAHEHSAVETSDSPQI